MRAVPFANYQPLRFGSFSAHTNSISVRESLYFPHAATCNPDFAAPDSGPDCSFSLRCGCPRSHAPSECAIDIGFTVTSPIIAVENLTKRYGDVQALRGVSFSVQEGEVSGLLGPNGAGKTSTVEILEGMRPADGGSAVVCGLDPHASGGRLKELIGAVPQSTALPDKIRVGEALNLFASFYKRHRDTAQLLQRFGLEEKRHAFYSQLSGGQKQRLALAMALVNEPRVVFLDQPTAGLDPQVRREIYAIIEELKTAGTTLLLTTHYIEEAERLCDARLSWTTARSSRRTCCASLKQRSAAKTRIGSPRRALTPTPCSAQLEAVVGADRLMVRMPRSSLPPCTIVALVKYLEPQERVAEPEIATPSLEDVFLDPPAGGCAIEIRRDAHEDPHAPGAAQPRLYHLQSVHSDAVCLPLCRPAGA